MRVVLDTNVLVRSHKKARGPARECLELLQSDPHAILVSSYLLTELARVLSYPRLMAIHRLSPEEIAEFLAAIRTVSEWVDCKSDEAEAIVSADPDDDPILQLAFVGKAEVLCTLDRDLRTDEVRRICSAQGVRILTDVELLAELRNAGTDAAQSD